ncbi:MAG: hypothetical protein AB8H80_01060 [Planctomycetota bacterium]
MHSASPEENPKGSSAAPGGAADNAFADNAFAGDATAGNATAGNATAGGAGSGRRGTDPCMQIQVDLSAMLDGELDPAGVRRVTVHSDVCPQCREFLVGIREQVGLHRHLAKVMPAEGGDPGAAAPAEAPGGGTPGGGTPGGGTPGGGNQATGHPQPAAASLSGSSAGSFAGGGGVSHPELRRELTDNQRKLSRVLYELGRNFALMGLSPEFSREVAKEPMPVPDMAMRGRNLLDEIARDAVGITSDSIHAGGLQEEWVAAKELFDGRLRTPEDNLASGQRLLTECLALDEAAHDARIYLGLVHYARGQRVLARKQFRVVIDRSDDEVMRGFAQSNLSNIHLDEGDFEGAIELLEPLADSPVVKRQPRLLAARFNLALAYGFQGDFAASQHWFGRLHEDAPHRRRWVSRELSRRSHFLHLVHTHPAAEPLARRLHDWFPLEKTGIAADKSAG